MNLNQLYYFVTLAHVEHYTKAAEMLSITQPSLSHAISMLEQELQTHLFEKRGRNVALTKYGKIFLGYVEESLSILESGVKKTRALTGEKSGMIDLAYIYTLGTVFAPDLVGKFLRAHKDWDIRFSFAVGNTTEIIRGLKEEKYDIAFCSRKEKETDIEFIPIKKENLVLVIPKGHPLSNRKEIRLEDTFDYPHICFTKTSGLRPVVDALYMRAGRMPDIAYEIEEDGAMAGLVSQNFGIAVMPEIPILRNLDVEILEISSPTYERYVYMARQKDRYLSPAAQEFVRFVQEHYEQGGHC